MLGLAEGKTANRGLDVQREAAPLLRNVQTRDRERISIYARALIHQINFLQRFCRQSF
jgi:hypothetical protein